MWNTPFTSFENNELCWQQGLHRQWDILFSDNYYIFWQWQIYNSNPLKDKGYVLLCLCTTGIIGLGVRYILMSVCPSHSYEHNISGTPEEISSNTSQMVIWTQKIWWSKVKVTVTSQNEFLSITQEFMLMLIIKGMKFHIPKVTMPEAKLLQNYQNSAFKCLGCLFLSKDLYGGFENF